jgi:hypothetical protein
MFAPINTSPVTASLTNPEILYSLVCPAVCRFKQNNKRIANIFQSNAKYQNSILIKNI